ncbi:uncharacterized protein FA14DRAFT_162373 [Meira miltonrushii]|uniref:RING-type domain-containing protein n=1 Tax=Meira miltonrushii TaxID=1280837 RepID=A0A316V3U4_9BASI|nr:uncharacterized protein FA14DRAFT_162373 [Meira miltonrushii]PWN32122.1 hypothetical protein FA14DRAFT_162373 [Meira miltonrushii]
MSASTSRTPSHSSSQPIRRRSSVRSTTSSSSRFSEIHQREYVYALDDQSISEWLKCPICLNPFIEPSLIPSCEHVFCKGCIEQHVETISQSRTNDSTEDENVEQSQYQKQAKGHCPSCRTRFVSSQLRPAAALIRNMVDSLLVKCPNESRGCAHLAERGLIEGHVRKDCAFAYIDEAEVVNSGQAISSNGRCGCGKKVMRKDWQAHITSGDCSIERISCPFANVEDGCGVMVRESDLEHHLSSCPAKIEQCQHCTLELRQDEIDEHEGRCEEVVVGCPLAPYCHWRGRRGDLGTEADEDHQATMHLANCKLAPLRSFLDSNTATLNDLEQDNRRLTQRMTTMEENQKDLVKLLSHCIAAIGQEYTPYQETGSPQTPLRNAETISSPPQQSSGAAVPPPLARRGRARSATGLTRLNLDETEDGESVGGQLVLAPYASAPIADSAEEEPWHWPEDLRTNNQSDEGTVFDQVSTHLNRLSLSNGSNTSPSSIAGSLRSINVNLSTLSERITKVERRLDDAHVVSMNAGFEAGRAHDELNSVRHGMHSIRLQMHSLLMQQQMERSLPHPAGPQGPPTGPHGLYAAAAVAAQQQQQHPDASPHPVQAGNTHTFHNGQPPPAGMMGLRRFWTGFEQTRL